MSDIPYKVEKTPEAVKITFEMPGFTHIQEYSAHLTDKQIKEEVAKVVNPSNPS